MDWWAWLTAGGLAGVVGVGLSVWRARREMQGDPLIQWLVKGKTTGPDHLAISVKPIGGTVRDVRLQLHVLGGRIEHPPLARAEWPTEKPTLTFTLTLPGVGTVSRLAYVQLLYRPDSQPTRRFEEWHAVFMDGPAYEAGLDQDSRSAVRTFWYALLGHSVGPGPKELSRRRVTPGVARREIRRDRRRVAAQQRTAKSTATPEQ